MTLTARSPDGLVASMTRTIALILQHKGYAVDVAQDGLTAIEKVEQTPFDAVLMDIKMPRMSGVEAHRRIKAIHPRMPVIMMTAYALEDLVAEALQEGAYAVVYKPLGIDRVIELIEEARNRRPAAS